MHDIWTPDDQNPGQGIEVDSTTVFERDLLGRLVAVDSPGDGADAEYLYDEHDRLVEVQLSDGSNVQVRRFVYDKIGRLRSATNPENNTVIYDQYDPRGKLLQYTDAMGRVFTSTYDDAGRLLTRSVDSLLLVENTYDGSGAGASEGRLTKQKSYQIDDGVSTLVSTRKLAYGTANGSAACTTDTTGISIPRGYAGLNGRLSSETMNIAAWNVDVETRYCQDKLGLPYMTIYPDSSGSGRDSRSHVGAEYNNGLLWEMHDLGRGLGVHQRRLLQRVRRHHSDCSRQWRQEQYELRQSITPIQSGHDCVVHP